MNQHEFNQLLEKYLAGDCTPDEEKLIHDWQAHLLQNTSLTLEEPEKNGVKKRLWQNIQQIVWMPEAEIVRPRWRWVSWAAAASVVVLAGVFWWNTRRIDVNDVAISPLVETPNGIEVKNTAANPREIKLEDGSIVLLKTNSSVTYPEHFGQKNLSVFLKGEAFFKVKHDPTKPFVVHAGELVTEVLGTSFTVKSYEESQAIEVVVATGRVSVYENSTKKPLQRNGVILTPNQKITFDKTSRKLTPSLIERPVVIHVPSTPSLFVFEETPLPKVLKKLENAYGVQIIVENQTLNQCVFTADLNELPLHTQLDLICRSINATYEQRGTSLFINGEGCK